MLNPWLACFPKAAVPLMGIYEQHPCQGPEGLKGCDIVPPLGCPSVMQRTLEPGYVGSVTAPKPAGRTYNSRGDSLSVKVLDTFFAMSFSKEKSCAS